MFILLVNDDGIDSIGLRVLLKAAVKRGHRVMVCAPAEQQSAASQRIHLNAPIMVHRRSDIEGCEAWAISGTPADCVRLAYELTDKKPDVCFSGINDGENAGSAVFYSGTVSAAREAAMHLTPAYAVSIMPGWTEEMLEALAEKSLDIADRNVLTSYPRLSVVNINAPALPPAEWKGIRFCPVSQAFYHDSYVRRISPRGREYFWIDAGLPMDEPEAGSDYDLLRKGYLTVSVIGGYADLNGQAEKFLNIGV